MPRDGLDYFECTNRRYRADLVTGVRVVITVIKQRPPSGLAGVVWTAQGEDINIKYGDTMYRDEGSIGWTRASWGAGYYWSLGSREKLWEGCNTLDCKGRWLFRNPDAAFASLCLFVHQNLVFGLRSWK